MTWEQLFETHIKQLEEFIEDLKTDKDGLWYAIGIITQLFVELDDCGKMGVLPDTAKELRAKLLELELQTLKYIREV